VIVAWHEVPGTAPPRKDRPVGYGVRYRAGSGNGPLRCEIFWGFAAPDHPCLDVRSGALFRARRSWWTIPRVKTGLNPGRRPLDPAGHKTKTYPTGQYFRGALPRHFVPGYDRTVPPGPYPGFLDVTLSEGVRFRRCFSLCSSQIRVQTPSNLTVFQQNLDRRLTLLPSSYISRCS
jgi:hypothetical protein